jgi:Fur family transcriptional regulator, ferric uptake regulator
MSHETMDYEGVLHAAGHRVTPQRVMILDAVCDGGGHTTLKQVYTRVTHMDDTIDRSSIYRTLKLFVELGLVVSAETSAGGTVYEIPKPKPHHHLVCRVCGKEEEIGQEALAGTLAFVRERYGFAVDREHLVLTGVCRDCHTSTAATDRSARWLNEPSCT